MQTKTTRPGRRQVSRARVARLLGEGGLSYRQIASAAGCSLKTVSRIADETKLTNPQQDRLDELQRHLEAGLPTPSRAKRYVQLVKQDDQLMVSLKTLERVDSLLGIVTDRDRLRVQSVVQEKPNQYLFFLPAGSNVQVGTSKTLSVRSIVHDSESGYAIQGDSNALEAQQSVPCAMEPALGVAFEPTASPGRHPQPVAPTSADDP